MKYLEIFIFYKLRRFLSSNRNYSKKQKKTTKQKIKKTSKCILNYCSYLFYFLHFFTEAFQAIVVNSMALVANMLDVPVHRHAVLPNVEM